MSLKSRILWPLSLSCIVLTLTTSSRAQIVTDYLYTTDYGQLTIGNLTENLLRYSFTYNAGTNVMSAVTADPGVGMTGANFMPGIEGITGTSDSVIATSQTGVERYNEVSGQTSLINITLGGTTHTLQGTAGLATDGTYLYVAEETGKFGAAGGTGTGVVDKIQLSNGAIVGQYSLAGAHDVALAPDGLLYVAGYSGTTGIQVINPNTMTLTGTGTNGLVKTLITNGADGTGTITRPTGLTFTGTATSYTLIAQSNSATQNDDEEGVFKITNATGTTSSTPALGTSTFHKPGNLTFTFGNAIGPNGDLFVAELGDGSGTSYPSVVDGVYELNSTTFAAGTTYVKGYTQPATGGVGTPVTTPASGLVAPKYVVFNTDFTPNGDQGVTPEPGAVALFASLGAAGFGVMRRRLKRR